MIRQILLITDGCSNVGVSPVMAAAHAQAERIVVNVIGVVDQGEIGVQGRQEIEQIAAAGGGMSRIVNSQQLAQTVHMMTRKTVAMTIQQAVQRELKQALGQDSTLDLPPEQRGKVVQAIDHLTETTDLKVALLVDTSASMKPKLPAVEEAIRDLVLSLQAREGHSEVAVYHFPASRGQEEVALAVDWTTELTSLNRLFQQVSMKGATPTGPALLRVIDELVEERTVRRNEDHHIEEISAGAEVSRTENSKASHAEVGRFTTRNTTRADNDRYHRVNETNANEGVLRDYVF